MLKIISEMTISRYKKDRSNGSFSFAYTSFNEKSELVNQLFEYYERLGVDKYELYEGGTISWRLNGNLYNSEEIGRMLKLKVFV